MSSRIVNVYALVLVAAAAGCSRAVVPTTSGVTGCGARLSLPTTPKLAYDFLNTTFEATLEGNLDHYHCGT